MDIETIDMDHEKDDLITFGMIEGNELYVIQRKLKDPAAFYAYLSENVPPKLPYRFMLTITNLKKDFLVSSLASRPHSWILWSRGEVKADEIKFKHPTLDELIPALETYIGERRTTAMDIVFP